MFAACRPRERERPRGTIVMCRQDGPRTALSHRICTGLRRRTLAKLTGELSGPWMKAGEDRLRGRRGHERKRAASTGPDYDLPFTNRVIATLVYLRFQLPHAALAVLYGVDRSTITRAVGEIRPLLAARGFAVPSKAGVRLRTLAGVFTYAAARGVELRVDGTEVQVRRPRAGKPGRRALCQARRSRTRKRPPSSPTGKAAPCAGASAQGGCTTRPRCGPRASPTCSPSSPRSRPRSMPGTAGWPRSSPIRSRPRRSSRRRTPPRKKPQPTRPNAQAVIGTDLRRARQRGAQAMANPPALPRTTRRLRRDLPGRHRPGLRPRAER